MHRPECLHLLTSLKNNIITITLNTLEMLFAQRTLPLSGGKHSIKKQDLKKSTAYKCQCLSVLGHIAVFAHKWKRLRHTGGMWIPIPRLFSNKTEKLEMTKYLYFIALMRFKAVWLSELEIFSSLPRTDYLCINQVLT